MRWLILPWLVALSACSLTPALVKPAAPVPAEFPSTEFPDASARVTGAHTADLGWRSMFGDARLQHLIELALANNRDLRIATLNVDAVRAQYRIERAARLPRFDATGNQTRQRIAASPTTDADIQQQVGLNIGLSAFDVDLFGRTRALSDAAFARYLASDQGRRAAQIALVAAVADAYLAERLAHEQHALAERTLDDWRQSLDLARRLREADQHSGLDVAQAEGQVAAASADVEGRARDVAQARNALRLLVGTDLPAALPDPLPLDAQPIMTELPEGLPSELLVRRPDVLQAEQNLVAANADIGAARAAFFPQITLTASMGYASPAMNGLFDNEHRVWSFAPQISLPLFHGGRLRAELRLAEVRTSSAVADYERTIQIAFREVADGLAGRATYGRQIGAQMQAVASAERRVALSELRYRAGLDARLDLLDAQRQVYATRQALLDLRRS